MTQFPKLPIQNLFEIKAKEKFSQLCGDRFIDTKDLWQMFLSGIEFGIEIPKEIVDDE